MEVLVAIFLIVVLVGVGFLLWWLVTHYSQQETQVQPAEEKKEEERETSKIVEFTGLYRELFEGILLLIDTGDVEDRRKVNDTIYSLSDMVCKNNSDVLKSLYMRKITCLTNEIESCSKSIDLNNPEVISRREDLAAISESLAQTFSQCIKVDVDKLQVFFNLTDTLFLTYNVSKDTTTKNKLRKHILGLVDRLTLQQK